MRNEAASDYFTGPGDVYDLSSVYADGRGAVIQSAPLTALTAIQSVVPAKQMSALHLSQQQGEQLWLTTTTDPTGKYEQWLNVDAVSKDGERLLDQEDALGRTVIAYVPGLLVYPANIHDGSTWNSSGRILTTGDRYMATGHATAVKGTPCIAATVRIKPAGRATGPDADGFGSDDYTWCPGDILPRSVTERKNTAATLSSRASLDRLPSLSTRKLTSIGVGFLPLQTTMKIAATTTSGVTVGTQDNQLVAGLRVTNPDFESAVLGEVQLAERQWIAVPGGQVTEIATVGDLALMASTARTLTAYDASTGAEVWKTTLPDTVHVPIAVDGGGGAIVVTNDGSVMRVEAASGHIDWTTSVDTRGDVASVANRSYALVADAEGVLHCLNESNGREIWSGFDEVSGIAIDARRLILSESNVLLGVDPATGDEEWRVGLDGELPSVARVGDLAVVQTDQSVTAYTVDGKRRWRVSLPSRGATLGRGMIAGDDAVIVPGISAVEVISSNGTKLKTITLPAAWNARINALIPRPDGAWVVGNSTLFIGRRATP